VTRVKICGVTNSEDARDAALLGADAIGLNFFPDSPRFVTPERAMGIIDSLPPFVTSVGVFVNYGDPEALEDFASSIRLDAVQLHGDESPDYCSMISRVKVIKAFRVDPNFRVERLRSYSVSGILLDAYSADEYGGTGHTFNWPQAAGANAFGRIVLAGGLNPDNVEAAVDQLHPFAVDVSSGVETAPGKKDYDRMYRFMDAVHRADGASLISGK
jgi:phosphoribosylanthranilate isomerase